MVQIDLPDISPGKPYSKTRQLDRAGTQSRTAQRELVFCNSHRAHLVALSKVIQVGFEGKRKARKELCECAYRILQIQIKSNKFYLMFQYL